MAIDKATVARIARLARLHVPEDQQETLAADLTGILAWVEQLAEVDTEGVAPMTSVLEVPLRRRPDEVTEGGIRDDVLASAPRATGEFYTVPKVVD